MCILYPSNCRDTKTHLGNKYSLKEGECGLKGRESGELLVWDPLTTGLCTPDATPHTTVWGDDMMSSIQWGWAWATGICVLSDWRKPKGLHHPRPPWGGLPVPWSTGLAWNPLRCHLPTANLRGPMPFGPIIWYSLPGPNPLVWLKIENMVKSMNYSNKVNQ